MGGISPDTMPSARGSEGRLDSWKEIAAYFNRDVTTVQRWEKREGMPVHRHLHDRMGSVYAYRTELETWARGRKLRAAQENGNAAGSSVSPVPPPQTETPAQAPSFVTRRRLLLLLVALCILAIGAGLWLQRTEYFWRNPIADFRSHTLTDFDGVKEAAAMSRDGHFVAFLADRDGPMDIWVTQVGSGQFQNLTHGMLPDLANPSIRTMGFSPDGSMVTFWDRKLGVSGAGDISMWAVPTLGGQPRPYLDGVAEADWSTDGSRLAYHTPGPGDPLFVANGSPRPGERPIIHCPCRAPLSLSLVVTRRRLRLFRPGRAPRQNGHLAHPFRRGNSRTNDVTLRIGKLSGFPRSPHAAVSRERRRWLGAMAS